MSAIENINQDELTLHQQDQIAAEIGTKSKFITLGRKIVPYIYRYPLIQEEFCSGVSEKKLRLDQ
jgi:hypothetical protein